MAATAGYNSTLKVTGTSTALTAEAVTLSGSDPTKRATITNAAKRVLDPTVEVVVKDGVATVPAANYTVNHLMGYVTFVDYTVLGTITIDSGSYLPTYAIAQGRTTRYSAKKAELDISVFSATVVAEKIMMGLNSYDGDFELIDTPYVDYNTDVGGVQSLWADFIAGTMKVLETTIGTETARFFVHFPGLSDDASVKDLYKRKVQWKSTIPQGAVSACTNSAGFSWQ